MIEILFSCKQCGLVKAKAFVRYRRDDEDILDWMKEVQEAVSLAHDLASPGIPTLKYPVDCRPKELSEIYIPMSDGKGVGCKP